MGERPTPRRRRPPVEGLHQGLSERQIEQAVVRYAEGNGWLVRKIIYPGRHGCPDRLFAKGGRVVFIEFKRPGERPRQDQKREHDRLRDAGLQVQVIDNIEMGKAVLACDL